MSNGKAMITLLIVGQIKKTLYEMSEYFPKPYEPFGENVKVELNLPIQKNQIQKKRINNADKKIPDGCELVKEADQNAKITETERKIPGITGLATTAALTAVENKIPNVSNLVKKVDYYAKISDIESKYFTTANCNKFTSQTLDTKVKQKELVHKSAIAGFINNADLDKKSRNISNKSRIKSRTR